MSDIISGGSPASFKVAPKGRRLAAAAIDLLFIPIVLGFIVGSLLNNNIVENYVSELLRSIILIMVNAGWLIFRDSIFSIGRKHVLRKASAITWIFFCVVSMLVGAFLIDEPGLIVLGVVMLIVPVLILVFDRAGPDADLDIVNKAGQKPSYLEALKRNLLIIFPFLLVSGYACEATKVFIPNSLLIVRKLFYAVIFLLLTAIAVIVFATPESTILAKIFSLLPVFPPILAFLLDGKSAEGKRLMEAFSETQIIVAQRSASV